ncbi:MAG: hypothetical protein J5J06_02450 [Phycisphaerae bacterium]|nr:hypothetical protein [Phycisphaerae bacterium]
MRVVPPGRGYLLPVLLIVSAGLFSGCAAHAPSKELVYFPPRPATPRAVHLLSFDHMDEVVRLRANWIDVLRGGRAAPYAGTPAGIAFHGSSLYICDTDANVVHVWNLEEGIAVRLGDAGTNALAKPVDVAVGDDGTVYVADTGLEEVVCFAPDGSAGKRFRPEGKEKFQPVALAVHAGQLYVADVAGLTIDVFGSESGTTARSIALPSVDDRKVFPVGLAFSATGNLLVSDGMGSRVVEIDDEGKVLKTIGRPGDRYGDLGRPRHIDIGPDGVLYIADAAFAHVHLFNEAGQLLMLIGGDRGGPAGTPLPVSVAVAKSVPTAIARLVPADFQPAYYIFISNTVGSKRIALFAVGMGK